MASLGGLDLTIFWQNRAGIIAGFVSRRLAPQPRANSAFKAIGQAESGRDDYDVKTWKQSVRRSRLYPLARATRRHQIAKSQLAPMPATIATVVITIGCARLCPASMIASIARFRAPFLNRKVNQQIEFLLTIQQHEHPIITGMETGWPTSETNAAQRRQRQGAHVHKWRHHALVRRGRGVPNTSGTPEISAMTKLTASSACPFVFTHSFVRDA
ncbi:MAG: hypothetical protein U5J78_03070 [Parasphingorhabdus sp.]|nr:hypothetical protein [Parasphingorhabdus sp.]